MDVYYEWIKVVANCDGALYVSIKANKKVSKQNNIFGHTRVENKLQTPSSGLKLDYNNNINNNNNNNNNNNSNKIIIIIIAICFMYC